MGRRPSAVCCYDRSAESTLIDSISVSTRFTVVFLVAHAAPFSSFVERALLGARAVDTMASEWTAHQLAPLPQESVASAPGPFPTAAAAACALHAPTAALCAAVPPEEDTRPPPFDRLLAFAVFALAERRHCPGAPLPPLLPMALSLLPPPPQRFLHTGTPCRFERYDVSVVNAESNEERRVVEYQWQPHVRQKGPKKAPKRRTTKAQSLRCARALTPSHPTIAVRWGDQTSPGYESVHFGLCFPGLGTPYDDDEAPGEATNRGNSLAVTSHYGTANRGLCADGVDDLEIGKHADPRRFKGAGFVTTLHVDFASNRVLVWTTPKCDVPPIVVHPSVDLAAVGPVVPVAGLAEDCHAVAVWADCLPSTAVMPPPAFAAAAADPGAACDPDKAT